MGAGRGLSAWGSRGKFTYQSAPDGTLKVTYRHGESFLVPSAIMAELRAHFAGAVVEIGASRNPPRDSLNAWLRRRLPAVEVPVAYVGPILVAEGFTSKEGPTTLRFE